VIIHVAPRYAFPNLAARALPAYREHTYLVAFAWSSQNLMSISQSVVSLSRDVPAPPLAGDTPVELAEAEGATVRSRYIQQRDRAVVVLDHPLMP